MTAQIISLARKKQEKDAAWQKILQLSLSKHRLYAAMREDQRQAALLLMAAYAGPRLVANVLPLITPEELHSCVCEAMKIRPFGH